MATHFCCSPTCLMVLTLWATLCFRFSHVLISLLQQSTVVEKEIWNNDNFQYCLKKFRSYWIEIFLIFWNEIKKKISLLFLRFVSKICKKKKMFLVISCLKVTSFFFRNYIKISLKGVSIIFQMTRQTPWRHDLTRFI